MDTKLTKKKVRVLEKFISVLGMRFKGREQRKTKYLPAILLLTAVILSTFINDGSAELLDRVVAVVNKEIILYSELQHAMEQSNAAGEKKTEKEMLQELIDRTLLLEQAKKFRADMDTYALDEEKARKLIDDYINRRIKAFVHVPFEKIDSYYESHKDEFSGRDVYEAWDKIENRLKVGLLKEKTEEHILKLRKEAYIRIQLENE